MKKFILFLIILLGNICFSADVTILHTSDIHGRISPIIYNKCSDVGGFSRRVSLVNEIKSKNKNVLLLDSGDYFQGSLYYQYDLGKAEAKLLPYIQYDAIVLGNHEFDNGLKTLKRNIKLSKTTFLSANVHFKDKYLSTHVKPYIVKDFDGEKFLIIGITTPKVKNLSNTNEIVVTDPIDEINNIIKNVQHDKLIILSHCGIEEDKKIAENFSNITLILGGHNHYFFEKPDYSNNIPIVQDGEYGARVGIITLNDNRLSYSYENVNSNIKANNVVDKKIALTDKRLEKYTKNIIATSDIELIGEQNMLEKQQTNLGKIVLKSMSMPFKDEHIDGIITNAGSIRINRNISGNISLADLMETLPFDNKTVLVQIDGKHLKSILDKGKVSGRTYLQYILNLTQIEDNTMYNIVTNSYIAEGKDGYKDFKTAKVLKRDNKKPVILLKNYLLKIKVITESNI